METPPPYRKPNGMRYKRCWTPIFGVEFSVLHRPHISFAIGTMVFLVAIDLLPIFIFLYFIAI